MGKDNQSASINIETPYKDNRLFSILAVFMLVGDVYSFPLIRSMGMGELVFIITAPYFIIKNNSNITISRKHGLFVVFMLYGLVTSVIVGTVYDASFSNIGIRILRDFFYYFIIFFLGERYFDTGIFCKWVIRLSTVLAVFVILQAVVYLLFGFFIPGFPMNAAINDGGYMGRDLYSQYLAYARIAGYLKPNGFLCEPAHCAQCFLVALIIILYRDEDKGLSLMRNAVVISIAAILTMSTSAFVYMAVAWILWLFMEGKRNILKVIVLVIAIIAIVFIAYSRMDLNNMAKVISRFTNVFSGGPITKSSELRLLKGLSVFSEFPLVNKIFGIGFGTYTDIVSRMPMLSQTIMAETEYMNTFSYILVSSGVLGAIIMLGALWKVFRRASKISKVMVLALILMSLGSSIYSSAIIIWMMLIILYYTPSREYLIGQG